MSNPLVLGRLAWRPASLGLVFLVLLLSALSIVDTLSVYGFAPGTMSSFWRFTVLLPAATGMALSLLVMEALHTQAAWTLPRLRSGLFAGKVVAMVLVSTLVAYMMRPGAGDMSILSPLGIGALCFALGGIVADPLSTKIEARGVFAALALVAFRPEPLLRLAGAQPVLVGLLGAVGAFVLLLREFSLDRARERPFVAAMPAGTATEATRRAYWARSKPSDTEWSRPLWRAGTISWLRACNYEVFGGTSRGFMRGLVFQFVFIGGFAYYLGTPAMVAYLPAMALAWVGLQLQGRFLYPVSRRSRAALAFFGTVVEITSISIFAAATLTALHLIGPRPGVDANETAAEALPMVMFIIALAPIGQWGKVGRPVMTDRFGSTRHTLTAFAMISLWLVLAIVSHQTTEDLTVLTRVALAVVASAVSYPAYWLALRWYHAKKDLVFIPAG